MAKQEDQTPELDLASTGLEGTGIDINLLASEIKEQAKKDNAGASEDVAGAAQKAAEKAVAEAKEKKEEKPGADDVREIKISQEIKVGDEIKDGESFIPDGEYERGEDKVTIKDGKVESVVDKDGKEITPQAPAAKKKIDNPFVSEEEKAAAEVVVKDFSEAAALLTSKVGIEIKEISDIPKVVEKITDLQGSVETLTTEKNQLQDYKAVFEGMPEDLFSIVVKFLDGGDYREEIQNLARFNVDFSKSVENYSDKELIELYNPGKFSEEDYQDMDDNRAMQGVLSSAKSMYKNDKLKYTDVHKKYENDQKETKKSFDASMNTSLESLKKDVPYLQNSHRQKVEAVLKGGIYGVMDLYVDEKGNFKPEAGKLVALALYGEQAINSQRQIASRQAETSIVEQILKRVQTKEEKRSEQGGGAPSTIEGEEVRKFIQDVAPDQSQHNPFMKPMVEDK